MPGMNIYLSEEMYNRVKQEVVDKQILDARGNPAPSKLIQISLRLYFDK